MHICISGNLGSGKSTICSILEKKHGFKVHSAGTIQREAALRLGMETGELNILMKQDHHYDHLIDDTTVALAKSHPDQTIIFDSRMAWYFVEEAFKIYMVIDPAVAAERVVNSSRGKVESYANKEEAFQKLRERTLSETDRFQQLYQVNNLDYRNYNLILDSTCASPEKVSQVIYDEYLKYCACPTSDTVLLLSPRSLFPLQSAQSLRLDEVRQDRSYLIESSVSVVPFEFYHYILVGLPHVLAAALNQEEFLRTKLPDFKEDPLADSELVSRISALGVSDLREFEKIGNFKYSSYPKYYRNL